MDYRAVATLLGSLREEIQCYLNNALARRGIQDLVSTHGAILYLLYNNEGRLPMKEIASCLTRRKSSITDLVRALVKNGYVTRCECHQDGRVAYAVLTDKAWRIKPELDAVTDTFLKDFYAGFTEREKEQLAVLLARAKNNLKNSCL